MAAYYNEFDPNAAAWLRELIHRGLIAPGDVDARSIVDVRPDDLAGYTQCHFFAGIGVWSYALRAAGWADDRPVWTGSPPCQPFSAAGKGLGTADERHLWPAFFHLIDVCRPDTFFGEQVASKDALAWLDHVSADVEGADYAFGAFDLCVAGFGAPHIRQRLKFVGTRTMANTTGRRQPWSSRRSTSQDERTAKCREQGGLGRMALPDDAFWRANLSRGNLDNGTDAGRSQGASDVGSGLTGSGMADDASVGRREERSNVGGLAARDRTQGLAAGLVDGGDALGRPSPTNGLWGNVDWLLCRDGKWRPVEPGTFPLAHGAPARVGRLRGYGNAIVAPAAAHFIAAFLESETDDHVVDAVQPRSLIDMDLLA